MIDSSWEHTSSLSELLVKEFEDGNTREVLRESFTLEEAKPFIYYQHKRVMETHYQKPNVLMKTMISPTTPGKLFADVAYT